jgi:hypothetical protein
MHFRIEPYTNALTVNVAHLKPPVTKSEAARTLGISRRTVIRYVERGLLSEDGKGRVSVADVRRIWRTPAKNGPRERLRPSAKETVRVRTEEPDSISKPMPLSEESSQREIAKLMLEMLEMGAEAKLMKVLFTASGLLAQSSAAGWLFIEGCTDTSTWRASTLSAKARNRGVTRQAEHQRFRRAIRVIRATAGNTVADAILQQRGLGGPRNRNDVALADRRD